MTIMKALSRVAVLLLAVLVLGSCYMPVWFDVEVELDRHGYYDITFSGYMAKIELYNKLRKREIDRAEEMRQAGLIEADFMRDGSVKKFEYKKDGIFEVLWEKSGDLLRTKSVTFFRRNENFLSMRYLKPQGVIIMEGTPIARSNAKRLEEIGLGVEGQLRVRTDAPILGHNATKELKGKTPRQKVLVWNLRGLRDPRPYLKIGMR